MRAYIKGIAVFNSEQEKRSIKLEEGLNIITGLSQTGKSAIYDIVDWCLGSEKFVIPKGIISKFTKLYSILIDIKGVTYLIARKGEYEKRLMYFQIVSNNINIKNILLSDFKEDYFDTKKNILKKIEDAFNLSENTNESTELDFYKNTKNIGIRDSLAYIYQHQGIIADKFNLFFYPPTKTYFPVLAGWKTQEDFAKEKELNTLNSKIVKIQKNKKDIDQNNHFLRNNLVTKYFAYRSLNGEDISTNISLKEIFKNLELFPKSYKVNKPDKIHERQNTLTELLTPLRKEKILLSQQRNSLINAQNEGVGLKKWLNNVKDDRTSNSINKCPICNSPSLELNEIAHKIIEAEQWVEIELETIGNTEHKFTDEIIKLTDSIGDLKTKINILQDEFNLNKENIEKIQKEKPIEEQIYFSQRDVIAEANFLKQRWIKFDDKEFAKLLDEQEKLKIKVHDKTQNIINLYNDATNEIAGIMNSVVNELYFEHQPPQLKFNLNPSNKDDFDLFHYDEKDDDKIYLNQMGSASNYLACHIGLFVSFLCYFSIRDNSKVPSLLFLDQPSQVYFTSGKKLEEDHDIARVKKIYDTLLFWINFVEKEKKFKPQIIVSDHIEHLGSNTEYLKDYFRANWRDNKGFI
ncbi:MAG: hypothetical protein COC06_05800 [Bacteroidales bacterium]|nr:MAG: hypothetical protein COC06_05800 [Bacteroidales bacterium]